MIFPHTILVSGKDFAACCQQVRGFLQGNKVLDYESLEFIEAESCCGTDPNFCRRLSASIKKHQQNIIFLINELNQMGFHSVDDIQNMEQGYPSKLLHILGHLTDGYVCVDSRFYNLIDHGHQVSSATVASIKKTPSQYWLIRLNGHRASNLEASLSE